MRKTAAERRDEIIDAALEEFSDRGYHGASTDAIARRAGVSQPYLFRLFGTKKDLFLASMERCFRETRAVFERAAETADRSQILPAMGHAYVELLSGDKVKLRMQMQAHAASDDPEIRAAARRNFADLVAYVQRVSGADDKRIRDFMSRGMLLNVIAAMGLIEEQEDWSERLLQACRDDPL